MSAPYINFNKGIVFFFLLALHSTVLSCWHSAAAYQGDVFYLKRSFDQHVISESTHLPCVQEGPGLNSGWIMDYYDRILVVFLNPFTSKT
jgi:hypothetical protein